VISRPPLRSPRAVRSTACAKLMRVAGNDQPSRRGRLSAGFTDAGYGGARSSMLAVVLSSLLGSPKKGTAALYRKRRSLPSDRHQFVERLRRSACGARARQGVLRPGIPQAHALAIADFYIAVASRAATPSFPRDRPAPTPAST
jgi:hypothetical protein